MRRCRLTVVLWYSVCALTLLLITSRWSLTGFSHRNISQQPRRPDGDTYHAQHAIELRIQAAATDRDDVTSERVCSNDDRLDRVRQVCAQQTTTSSSASTSSSTVLSERQQSASNTVAQSLNLTASIATKNKYKFILVDDAHKVLYCAVPKAASTTWKTVLAIATGRTAASSMAEHEVEDPSFLRRIGLRFLSTYSESGVQKRLATYSKFLAVRHPLDRLVSAYSDKVARFNSYGMRIRRDIMQHAREKSRQKDDVQHSRNAALNSPFQQILFTDFIRFVVDGDVTSYDDHWALYSTLCHVCHIQYDFIVKLDTIQRDSLAILRLLGLTGRAWQDGVLPRMNSRHKPKRDVRLSTHRRLTLYENISSSDMDALLRIYANDMQMFGYQWRSRSSTAVCEMHDVSVVDYQCC